MKPEQPDRDPPPANPELPVAECPACKKETLVKINDIRRRNIWRCRNCGYEENWGYG